MPDEPADVIVSLDSFEHFQDPAAILRVMDSYLSPHGKVLATFGPTWYHPLGGHIFSVFPWAHLLFTESALLRWRKSFHPDQTATTFEECGLNKITIGSHGSFITTSLMGAVSMKRGSRSGFDAGDAMPGSQVVADSTPRSASAGI